jgi:sugar/nucleoside kinase (ribokinase family)
VTARRIVVVGDVVTDVVVRRLEPEAPDSDAAARIVTGGGGAGGNVAAWLAGSGVPTTLVARVGDDRAGRWHAAELERRGVSLALARDAGIGTGTVVVLTEPSGARTMLTDRGASARLDVADLPQPLGTAEDHLHMSGYVLLDRGSRAAGLAALGRARAHGMTTSVDVSSAAPLAGLGASTFRGWLTGVDILKAALAEARLLAPAADGAEKAARALAEDHPIGLVTAGAGGAWLAAGTTCVHRAPIGGAFVDAVGAGDAATAGFLAAWTSGSTPPDALDAAVRLAARAIAVSGGRPPLG